MRFKIEDTWFSTDQNCMIASEDETPPDGDAENAEDQDSDEPVQPKKSKKKKNNAFSRRRAPISFGAYALAGGFEASGEGEKIQLGFGGGVKGQFGELFAGKLQYARSSRTLDSSGGAKISLSRSELTLIPLATFGSVYVGPQVGLASVSLSAEGGGESVSVSSSVIEFGANLGLNFEINSHFSLGPDFHFTHIPGFEIGGSNFESSSILKLFLALNVMI
ncbi:MAG: hypothetical protein KGQ59_08015 [Bdellovibrionales bacterium]|nr:hypothetical protein [Bdellovibrionales bacterium]